MVNITKFLSGFPDDRVLLRFYLQSVARDLLPNERVQVCYRHRVPGERVKVVYSKSAKRAHYMNLMRCSSVWACPVCSAKITEGRRVELQRGVESAKKKGLTVIMATFTLRHKASDSLAEVLGGLLRAFEKFLGGENWTLIGDVYGYEGCVRALEVTHGKMNGWHPHLHVLIVLKHPLAVWKKSKWIDLPIRAGFEAALKGRWEYMLDQQGFDASWERGVTLRSGWDWIADYVAKWNHEPITATERWTLVHELTKAPSKRGRGPDGEHRTPMQILSDYAEFGELVDARLFQEYVRVFKGRRQLRWSPGLKTLLGIVAATDEELAARDPSDTMVCGELSSRQWKIILDAGLQADLLKVASGGDVFAFWDWLDQVPGMYGYFYERTGKNTVASFAVGDKVHVRVDGSGYFWRGRVLEIDRARVLVDMWLRGGFKQVNIVREWVHPSFLSLAESWDDEEEWYKSQ